jgi:hypothetical protein
MPLPTFPTLDEIPEAFRSEYEERNGEWHPKAPAAPDVTGLTSALEKERTAARNADKARRDAEKERDDLKRTVDAKAKGISEEELQKIRDAEAAARKPIEEENVTLKADIRKLKLTDRVQALYLGNGGMKDRLEDAMNALAPRTDLGDADGIVFKDKAGQVTADDAEKFFAKHKQEKPWLYEGTGGSGSGTPIDINAPEQQRAAAPVVDRKRRESAYGAL